MKYGWTRGVAPIAASAQSSLAEWSKDVAQRLNAQMRWNETMAKQAEAIVDWMKAQRDVTVNHTDILTKMQPVLSGIVAMAEGLVALEKRIEALEAAQKRREGEI